MSGWWSTSWMRSGARYRLAHPHLERPATRYDQRSTVPPPDDPLRAVCPYSPAISNLTNDQKTGELARATAASLLKAAESVIATGLKPPWLRRGCSARCTAGGVLPCRTAEAALMLTERGFTIEVAPLVRNVFNHAYAINWLVDNGDAAVDALVARGDDEREKLCKKLEETGWTGAAEMRATLELAATQRSTLPARTASEQELHEKFKYELKNFYDMLERYDVADVYPVYSHLSSLSHTTMATASAYVEHMDDGTLQARQNAAKLGDADVIQLAVALLQAASVVSPLIDDDPLRPSIDQALTDLGLENTQLLPTRVK
ncbi:DUF5677 domain-containing protein [Spongiactinospora rosea]|nr:DUF5677 domain-containing protein [Spongiactinospora rosea]